MPDADDERHLQLFDQTGYNHLWAELQRVLAQRSALEAELGREIAARESRLDSLLAWGSAAVTVTLLVVAALVENRNIAFVAGFLFIVGRAAAFVVHQWVQTRQAEASRRYEPRFAELSRQANDVQARINTVQSDIERLLARG